MRSNLPLPGKINPLSVILLMLVVFSALIPAFYSFILSLIDYSPVYGLFGSPFTGLSNFAQVISHPAFPRLFLNTFVHWLASLSFALILGVPAAILISFVKRRKTAAACAGLLLIPVFIPASVYFTLIIELFSSKALMREQTYILAFAAQTLLPGAAMIAFSGVAVGLLYRSRHKGTLQGTLLGCGLAALLFMLITLSPAYETTLLSANPMVNRVADTFDTFTYRGLTQMQISHSAASYTLRSLLQMLLAVIPVIAIILLLKKSDLLFAQTAGTAPEELKEKAPGQATAWLLSIILMLALLLVMGLPSFTQFSSLAQRFLPSVLVPLFAVVVGFAASLMLLYGAAGSGRVILPIMALIILGTNNAIIAQYLLFRQLGMANTMLATPLTQWLQPPVLIVLLLFAILVQMMKNQTSFFFLALTAALLTGAHAYGSFIPHMIFTSVPQQYTMGVLFRQSQTMAEQVINPSDPGTIALIYMTTVLPCLVLGCGSALLVRKGLLDAV